MSRAPRGVYAAVAHEEAPNDEVQERGEASAERAEDDGREGSSHEVRAGAPGIGQFSIWAAKMAAAITDKDDTPPSEKHLL